MPQSSVAAYFNNRKRPVIEDKFSQANKVLVLDSDSLGDLVESELVKCEQKKTEHVASPKIESLPGSNKEPQVSLGKGKLRSKPSKPRVTRKLFGQAKDNKQLQQNLEQYFSIKSTKIEDKTEIISDLRTPPSTPTKMVNAMDRVDPCRSEMTLNEIKNKLSRSSRLAELKASLSRFNDGSRRLKEAEKKTAGVESPKLKVFKSIELEVELSPQKLQSPEKLYLSPKKDISAKKNLLNLLSPTKNKVALPSSPSKKIHELTAKPALTLPFKYRFLAEIFRSVDTICQIMFNRKETITLSKLKPAVEKMLKRNIAERHLAQINAVYPEAFELRYEKLRVFGAGRKEEKYELVVVPNTETEQITSEFLLERRRKLFDLLLNKVKMYHEEFLRSLDPPMHISLDKIMRWHPEFDIEKVPDIEQTNFPECPKEDVLSSGKDVLDKAREMFNCNARMEQALERLKASKEGKGETSEVDNNKQPESILKGIPKALLEKVRMKQAAKALVSLTRTADKEKELQMYSRLPELTRLARSIYVTEKRSALPLEKLMEKLGNCYTTYLNKSDMENHLRLLSKAVPEWMTFQEIRGTIYVKIVKNTDLSVVIKKLEDLTLKQSEL